MQLFISGAGYTGTNRTTGSDQKSNLVFIMRVSFLIIFLVAFSAQLLLAKNTAGQSADETFITLELKKCKSCRGL